VAVWQSGRNGNLRSGTLTTRSHVRVLLGTLLLAATFATPRADAATASWSVEPSVYDFGTVPSDAGPSAPAAFTLTNTGEVDLPPPRVELHYQSIESREPEIFEDNAYDCVVRAKLMPGESCTTKVVFQPIYPGPRNGTVTFIDPSSEVAPVSASFSGVGIGPIVSLTDPVFLTAVVGEGPSLPPKVLTVTNEGDAGLSISKISLVGENASHFAIVGGKCQPGVVVAPGASCGIQLTYSPTTAGFLFGELQLTDNAAHGSQNAGLQGLGVAPTPARVPSRSKPVRWSVVGRPGPRQVMISSTVGWCPGGAGPKPRIQRVRQVDRPHAVVLTVLLVHGVPKGDDCPGVELPIQVLVRFKQRRNGRPLFDGSVSPPARRWPR
jgi:hypothetical protein